MLNVCRRDTARPDGVKVNGEPAAANDIGISGGRVTPGEALFDAVRTPGEEGGVHLVQGDIAAVDIGETVHRRHPLCHHIVVGEVSAVHAAVSEGPEFDDRTPGKKQGEGVPYLFGICGHARPSVQSGIAGKSGGDT
ncbi:hypothetical protein MKMG_00768 [Methanogenium sp. MK-MG]|nr:hypothetical protein MKMG_00768 [Methanogenium sp. MK-MG]